MIDEKAGVPKAKTYALLGVTVLYFVLLVFNVAGALLTNLLGFLYPAYQSFKAIESSSKEDDLQWLTYWTVFGFFSVLEFWADLLIAWLPFYWLMKSVVVIYLFLPQIRVFHIFAEF
jgi:receptor expression-enhancing protein 5/6